MLLQCSSLAGIYVVGQKQYISSDTILQLLRSSSAGILPCSAIHPSTVTRFAQFVPTLIRMTCISFHPFIRMTYNSLQSYIKEKRGEPSINLPTGHSRSKVQLLFKRINQLVKTHFYYPEQYQYCSITGGFLVQRTLLHSLLLQHLGKDVWHSSSDNNIFHIPYPKSWAAGVSHL